MPQDHSMDTMIGVAEVKRDAEAASRHIASARAADKAGDRATSIAELRRAVKADPTNNSAAFDLAWRLDLAGEEDEALAVYEDACERGPAPVNLLVNLAVLYEDRESYSKAERCLRQVLETNPTHERARLYMKDVQAAREMTYDDEAEHDTQKRKAMLDTPVTEFELTVRARTCLKKLNIRTLGDLVRLTEAELMSYKNFGDSSLQEIKRMLVAKGLRLGMALEDAHRQARRQIADQLKGSATESLLNKPVAELALSVRARKALSLLNIQTLGDLASHTEAELMGVKNFGATSLQEIKVKLEENGLSLRKLDA